MSKFVLVGDVGGTNSRWAIFDGSIGPVSVTKTRDARSLREAAQRYLQGRPVQSCCVAVAGPVVEGMATLTNADWVADPRALEVPTRVLNDLEGAAYGVDLLGPDDVLWPSGTPQNDGVCLVLGVGTGFGGALIRDGQVLSLEPGHEPLFSTAEGSMYGLLVSGTTVEDLVSGPGLVRVWSHVQAEMEGGPHLDDAEISDWVVANAGADPFAAEVSRVFRSALVDASVALAIRLGAKRVLFMGGVVQGWALHLTQTGSWTEIERRSGCTIGLIQHPYPALLGAGRVGRLLIDRPS